MVSGGQLKKTLAVIVLAGSLGLMGAVPAMAYPADTPPTVTSPGNPTVGQPFVFSGTGFVPGETVTVTVRQGRGNGPVVSTYTVTADGSGAFTLSINIAKPGAFTVTATGASGETASKTIQVGSVTGNANGVALASTGGTSLANTGASPDLLLWSLVGAGALAAGTASVVVVRRRAKADASA